MHGGFTLVELLIALGLFAIGMIAMASLFPVAALLQRETAAEIIGEHAAESARAIVNAKQLTYTEGNATTDLGRYHDLAGNTRSQVVALQELNPNLLTDEFTLYDRSYPSGSPVTEPNSVQPDPNLLDERELFWVPLVQDIRGDRENPEFVMRLFLLESLNQNGYPRQRVEQVVGAASILQFANSVDDNTPAQRKLFPKVVAVSCRVNTDEDNEMTLGSVGGLEPGAIILDSNGVDYLIAEIQGNTVTTVTPILKSPTLPNRVWYAPALDGEANPTQQIKTIKINWDDPSAANNATP